MINNIFFKIFIVFLICTSTTYFAYQYYNDSKPVITIYPDDVPTKIKPSNIENANLPAVHSAIYENFISRDMHVKAINLVPDPEKPIIIISRTQKDDFLDIDSIDEISELISLMEQGNNLKNKVLEKQIEPEKNKTGLNIIKIDKQKESNNKVKNSYISGNYKVQLGSVKSEDEAMREGEQIKKKFPKILKNAVITSKKVKYEDGKFFYLIFAGDYETITQAKAVCKKLARNNQSCVLK